MNFHNSFFTTETGRRGVQWLILPVAFLCLVLNLPARAAGPDPIAEINAQYQNVLQAIKHPAVAGILVTELLPESAAGAAGVKAGDILTMYNGAKIINLQTLR